MKRKAAFAVFAVCILLVGAWFAFRAQYYSWRFAACTETAERLRAGKFTRGDELVSLLRSERKTYRDYEEAAGRHEAALLKLKYFTRTNFSLAYPLRSDEASTHFLSRAFQTFPGRRDWSATVSAKGDVVTVTAQPHRMADWEKLIREVEKANATAVRKCRNSIRRKPSCLS